MTKLKLKSILIVLILIMSIGTAIAATIVKEETVWSEYSGIFSVFGDKLVKTTYSDDSSAFQYVHKPSLQKLEIYAVQPITISVGQAVPVSMMLLGTSCSLGSGGAHDHVVKYYLGSGAGRVYVGQSTTVVMCGVFSNSVVSIPNSNFGTGLNTPGSYILSMEESVYVAGINAGGTNTFRYITVTAFTTTPTPTPTTPSQQNSYITVNSNVGGSVYIDNSMVGFAGNTFKTSVGGHSVKVTQSGYTTYSTSVTVDYGATVTVNAELSLVSTPTPTLSPTPAPTSAPPPDIYVCQDGSKVSDPKLCMKEQPGIKIIPDFITDFFKWIFGLFGA